MANAIEIASGSNVRVNGCTPQGWAACRFAGLKVVVDQVNQTVDSASAARVRREVSTYPG
jgi:hypothetical protein